MKKSSILLLIALLFAACSNQNNSEKIKPHVVTTTGMLYDAVINIAGDKMSAEAIMGPGVDPHLYKATQGDLSKLNRADIIIYNGILLEGKMTEILEKLGRTKPVIAAAQAIPDSLLLQSGNYADAFDPHVWFDVSKWKFVVNQISQSLIGIDSLNADYYSNQTDRYIARLDSLEKYVTYRLNEIPPNQRILITAHDAFGYFENAYDIQVEAIQGISTVADFGLRDIANLIDLILENKIKAIFVETSVSDKSINALITGCKEKGHKVEVGGYLYSDAMGDFGTEEGTYVGMFAHNVNTIVEALK